MSTSLLRILGVATATILAATGLAAQAIASAGQPPSAVPMAADPGGIVTTNIAAPR